MLPGPDPGTFPPTFCSALGKSASSYRVSHLPRALLDPRHCWLLAQCEALWMEGWGELEEAVGALENSSVGR